MYNVYNSEETWDAGKKTLTYIMIYKSRDNRKLFFFFWLKVIKEPLYGRIPPDVVFVARFVSSGRIFNEIVACQEFFGVVMPQASSVQPQRWLTLPNLIRMVSSFKSERSSFPLIAIVGITYRESHKTSIDGEVPWKSRARGKQKQIPWLPWLGLYYYRPLLSTNEFVGNHSVTSRLSTKCTRS